MNIEDQVCSLDFAKRLKELGVKQESYFTWSTDNNNKFFVDNEEVYPVDAHYPRPQVICCAFTVAELGELLPKLLNGCGITCMTAVSPFFGGFWSIACGGHIPIFLDATEANGRAKMLIYLLENKLI